ncbi:MAG TPA: GNAT family N-acetyltransferase [Methylomirabilota bacterium]|nr:GNAT family N-acetyltransferase [Methylomirabilota bacterium]
MTAIRDARPDDRAAILAVTLAAYEQYAAALTPPLWAVYRQNIQATLADVGPAAQLVAEDGGALVGAVLLFPTGSVMATPGRSITLPLPEVRLLAVAPAARGKGVARRLMEECIQRARAAGAPALTLHTTDMMAVAMRLYERLGFERTPELDIRPAPGILAKGYKRMLPRS